MMKISNVLFFLREKGWELLPLIKQGQRFSYFKPPTNLGFDEKYKLAIFGNITKEEFANISKNEGEFIKDLEYAEFLLNTIWEIYEDEFTMEDLKNLFATGNTILSIRFIDKDTQDGSIGLTRLKSTYNIVQKIIENVVEFIETKKPLMGYTNKKNARQVLTNCRALQSERGSYIAKFEIRANALLLDFGNAVSENIINKIIQAFLFFETILRNTPISSIDQQFIETHRDNINVELFESMITFFEKSVVANIEIKGSDLQQNQEIKIENIKKRLPHYKKVKQQIKTILLNTEEMSFVGEITTLYRAPKSEDTPLNSENALLNSKLKSSHKKEFTIETYEMEGNKTTSIKVIAENTETYEKAIKSHENRTSVKITGKVKTIGRKYVINPPYKIDWLN